MRFQSLVCVLLLAMGAEGASIQATAEVWGPNGLIVDQKSSNTPVSVSAEQSEQVAGGTNRLRMYGRGSSWFAGVGWESVLNGDPMESELYGSALVEVTNHVKMRGGWGTGYVTFWLYGGAGDGGVWFEALGEAASASGGAINDLGPLQFKFGKEFEIRLVATVNAVPGVDMDAFVGLMDISVTDEDGRELENAYLGSTVPEPGVGVMVGLGLVGLAAMAARRR